jgi:FkbM family methyltransferase
MNFSWVPFKPQIGRLLKSILPANLILPIFQGKLKGKRWVVGSSNIECVLGSYEYEVRVLFEAAVSKSSVVYDIGAHVGFYTLLSSELVGAAGRVIAFEPLPQNLSVLKKHIAMNRCANVEVIEAAVSDENGVSYFSEGYDSSTGRITPEGSLEISTVCLDDMVKGGKIPPPDFMKIDVEGAELLVLQGGSSLLADYSPRIFLSTHSPELSERCYDLLKSLNYTVKPIIGCDIHDATELFAYKDNE